MTEHGLRMPGKKDAGDDVTLLTQFLGSWKFWKLVGKMVLPQLEAAVRENDGTDGLPLYKTHGKDVYDLTSEFSPISAPMLDDA